VRSYFSCILLRGPQLVAEHKAKISGILLRVSSYVGGYRALKRAINKIFLDRDEGGVTGMSMY
jgi:hypothetical protein